MRGSVLLPLILLVACGGETIKPEVKDAKVVEPSPPVVKQVVEEQVEAEAVTTQTPPPETRSKSEPLAIAKENQINSISAVAVSADGLKEKIHYAQMMFRFTPAKRIMESGNKQAQDLLAQSKAKADKAKSQFAKNKVDEANLLVNESYQLMSAAAALVPSEHKKALEKARYSEMLEGLKHARELHQNNVEHLADKGEVASYDVAQVEQLASEAAILNGEGDYALANRKLKQARALVDQAIMAMLDKKTVVYAVDVSTPEKEYEYELGRYQSYEELIPVAIEMKRPGNGQKMLVKRRVDKANWMKKQSQETAASGDYPKAIRMVMDAAVEVRKALKIMKVETFE